MNDMNVKALGRRLLGRMQIAVAPTPAAGNYSLLALRLERDLDLRETGRSVLVAAADDDDAGVEAAVELAWALAEDLGRRVLLVDGSFEAAALTRALGYEAASGVSELLAAPARGREVVVAAVEPTTHARVAILAAGKCMAHLAVPGEAVRQLVEAASEAFDYVIVSGTLLHDSSRSLAFGAYVDATLLVAVEERSTLEQVSRAQRLLNDCGAHRVGLVLASAPARPARAKA